MRFTPQTKSGRIVMELPILLPLGANVESGKENALTLHILSVLTLRCYLETQINQQKT
jgi:hypothetical protein